MKRFESDITAFHFHGVGTECSHLIDIGMIIIRNNRLFGIFTYQLHVGDGLMFVGCRFLGNQDTIYTGSEGSRLLFTNCYIEGTTDFIFGPSTALFEYCELHSKRDSYITAASTPQNEEFGYVFKNCKPTNISRSPSVWRATACPKGAALFSIVKSLKVISPRDGTGKYRNIQDAVEAVRAFMDYTVTIYIKKGLNKE